MIFSDPKINPLDEMQMKFSSKKINQIKCSIYHHETYENLKIYLIEKKK